MHIARGVGLGAVALLLAGCSQEAGRLPFSGEGSASKTIDLKAGEVDFWTDLDLDYHGIASLNYDLKLSQGGKQVAFTFCDPLGKLPVKLGWVETSSGDESSRRGKGKMACAVVLPAGGPTLVAATLAFGAKPTQVTLKKADLVVKQ
jgi:hypothetical protein